MSNFVLTIQDIREWLIDHRAEYQKLKAMEYRPLGNETYFMYTSLHEFIQYYSYVDRCTKALNDLRPHVNTCFTNVIKWTKDNILLGSQDLLMFEINYFDWIEIVDKNVIKIHEGLYTERKPFLPILFFCKIFQILYWNNAIHEMEATEEEQTNIMAELNKLFKSYNEEII